MTGWWQLLTLLPGIMVIGFALWVLRLGERKEKEGWKEDEDSLINKRLKRSNKSNQRS